MIVVTGAAGFIGSCILGKLNERGLVEIIVVDDLDSTAFSEECLALKKANIQDKKYSQYYDKEDFLNLVAQNRLDTSVDCILHMGACSSTTLQDPEYFQKNNFEYSCHLARWALDHRARFIYASSAATYGDGSAGYKDDIETTRRCKPLNPYGQSKQDFDVWTLDHSVVDKMVGLKFFNVFGPNEYHKGEMKSVIAKSFRRVVEEGKMYLFKSYKDEYDDGEQKRDFIYIKDAVDIAMFFVDHPDINGIFNAGSGLARTWNDLANALFTAVGKAPNIIYIDMPEAMRPQYQYFTQADTAKLHQCGFTKTLTELEDAVDDYVKYLQDQRHL
jgi:ADP-L-glycero-D-manno-heptose 6-epimerase